MLKLAAAGVVALALGGACEAAYAQTAAQWSQLVGYVGQQSKLIIDLRLRMEKLEAENRVQREAINVTVGALDQERCRTSRLVGALQGLMQEPPVRPTFFEGVACSDMKSPVPPFPAPVTGFQ